jgi:putative transposase
MRCQFIQNHRETWPVTVQCQVLQVSRSVYYAWLKRPPSSTAIRRADRTNP